MNQGNDASRLGLFSGTLSEDYTGGIPVLGTTYGLGVDLASTAGLQLRMAVDVFRGTVTTANVIAETDGGRGDNVVLAGAHLDSVVAGPGIQDNGSGTAALLEIAIQMRNVNPWNKVRFAWWGAEEWGTVGSLHYLDDLSAGEIADIALYLNFDVIGSPNFVRFVYDGDGSDTGLPLPAGSAAIESLIGQYFTSRGLPFEPTDVAFRSDSVGFESVGVPVGGIYTGSESIKTAEEAALYGGTAGQAYDPCYHQACDTFANVSEQALDQNADAAAFAILSLSRSTQAVNGVKGKGPRAVREPGSLPDDVPIGTETPD